VRYLTFWLAQKNPPPVIAFSALGHFVVLPSLPMSTGISFDLYQHRCQDFCSLHGFRLTLEERQCTQPKIEFFFFLVSSDIESYIWRGSIKIEFFFFFENCNLRRCLTAYYCTVLRNRGPGKL
jgi:hypothetical protein